MPATHVAFLRGINVGKAKRIAMADLRTLVTSLGYKDVKTLLNSGNVVFSSTAAGARNPAGKIEKAVLSELGVSARVMVLTAAELRVVIANNALAKLASDHSRMMVGILHEAAHSAVITPLTKQDWTPGVLASGPRAAYYWCPDGILESRLAIAVARALKDNATARNWATILKLQALMEE